MKNIEVLIRNLRPLFIIYLLFLIVIAILPINSASGTLNNIHVISIRLDYLLHSLLFIPWIFLYRVAFRPETLADRLIMIGSGLLTAFATEGVQYFLTYRAYNINDLLANFLGVFLGAFTLFISGKQLRIKN